ncbi:MAG: hypothetical protein BJ554DRAFT_4130 [Olpidium bornovanus]|uniref:Uncharacterized protein n=1 Tax=Olpidium bornovanus TaxID=278681 RepID=A0A8H7ZMQ8_9FUNG|nr:MAG: hypothetical protein BJ554DRAFT_4130 [Olpidium bornovanus]
MRAEGPHPNLTPPHTHTPHPSLFPPGSRTRRSRVLFSLHPGDLLGKALSEGGGERGFSALLFFLRSAGWGKGSARCAKWGISLSRAHGDMEP